VALNNGLVERNGDVDVAELPEMIACWKDCFAQTLRLYKQANDP